MGRLDRTRTWLASAARQLPSGVRRRSRLAAFVVVAFASVAVVAVVGLSARSDGGAVAHAEDNPAQGLPAVTFFYAERGKPKSELILPGSIQALRETTIYARTNGYLKRWLVDIGDKVSAGQLLAEIETPELDQELQEAQARQGQIRVNLELARVTAERYKSLKDIDAASP